MTEITNTKQRDRIKKLVKKWQWIILNYGWQFEVHYCETSRDMPKEFENSDGGSFSYPSYMEGGIYFNLMACDKLNADEMEEVVVHELTHFLVSPIMKKPEEYQMEQTVTMISRAFLRMDNDRN